jgi:hypothetical protein
MSAQPTPIFVVNGMVENKEYGGLEIHSILGVYTSREKADSFVMKLASEGQRHFDAVNKAYEICNANEVPTGMWDVAMNKEYNLILQTEGLKYWEERGRFFHDYEIIEMPLL